MQHIKLVGVRLFVACAVVTGMSAAEQSYIARELHLSSLTGKCVLKTKWIGFWQQLDEAVVIDCCGGGDVLILQPNSLVGHMRVRTGEQALEYVRFFSSAESYKFFSLDGMVEIVPGDTAAPDAFFNVMDEKAFDSHFRRAGVRQTGDQPCKPGLEIACGKEFEIRRVVVFPNGRVYQIVESVHESGFYQVLSKKLLMKDATKIGILHFGNL